jgi:hypothetical protein
MPPTLARGKPSESPACNFVGGSQRRRPNRRRRFKFTSLVLNTAWSATLFLWIRGTPVGPAMPSGCFCNRPSGAVLYVSALGTCSSFAMVVDFVFLTDGNNFILGHGVTLLREVRAGLSTNPVTPPSPRRHHPDFAIAHSHWHRTVVGLRTPLHWYQKFAISALLSAPFSQHETTRTRFPSYTIH